MVRLAVAAAVLLTCSIALAQGRAGQSASGPVTVDGCLQGSGGRMTLFRENTAAAFRLVGNDSQLDSLTGHHVRITGAELPPQGNSPPQDMPRLEVERVEDLGTNCPPGAAPNRGLPSGNPPAAQPSPDFRRPGAPAASTMPPGGDANINTNAGGAPSPGTNDPRNISPSPQPIPSEVERQTKPDNAKNAKHKKKKQHSSTSTPH